MLNCVKSTSSALQGHGISCLETLIYTNSSAGLFKISLQMLCLKWKANKLLRIKLNKLSDQQQHYR